jgi:predicted ribosome quality control (RQC) complex YloA/Tae2 family protein
MIRLDSLLVRALGRALEVRYRDEPVRGLRLDPATRTAAFNFRRESLILSLDAADPWIHCVEGRPGRIESVLPAGLRVSSVRSPPDERVIVWTFESGEAGPPRVFVEWLTNSLNVLVVGPDERVRAVLTPRKGERRTLLAGAPYRLPVSTARIGGDSPLERSAFIALLEPIDPAERERELVRQVAYTSPLNAGPILGDARHRSSPEALHDAYDRYMAVLHPRDREACVFDGTGGPQPYPVPLPGVPCRPANDLLEAFNAARAITPVAPAHGAIARMERKREWLHARWRRLQEELAGAGSDAASLRHHAGLLLSQPHSAPKGTAAAILDDFQGGEVRVSLDPSLGPAENAEHMYETARKRERAATRLPQLIANARREAERVAGLVEDLRAGALPPEDAASAKLARAAPRQARALPYKRYRTSGGLEVRVGRGARTNDDLTFHHSRPDDIWLHARDAGGAHVILRWEDRDANPPAADLREAAILAAVQSKARTSGVVPVDWTRRKYVRKPRKAPPGRVTIERAKTLFVEPDAALAERLRVEEG